MFSFECLKVFFMTFYFSWELYCKGLDYLSINRNRKKFMSNFWPTKSWHVASSDLSTELSEAYYRKQMQTRQTILTVNLKQIHKPNNNPKPRGNQIWTATQGKNQDGNGGASGRSRREQSRRDGQDITTNGYWESMQLPVEFVFVLVAVFCFSSRIFGILDLSQGLQAFHTSLGFDSPMTCLFNACLWNHRLICQTWIYKAKKS